MDGNAYKHRILIILYSNSKKGCPIICHSRESGSPVSNINTIRWIPAFAGMTSLFLSFFSRMTIIGETGRWPYIDVCLTKTDSTGNVIWTRTYGGEYDDYGYCIDYTTDGGYIIAGKTYSFGILGSDVYLIKTDAEGDTLWSRTYSRNYYDCAYSVQQTDDGGYIIAGYTITTQNGHDIYVIKTDSSGDCVWAGTYGYNFNDIAHCIQQTYGGGYIVAGQADTSLDDDVYLIKLDLNGNSEWSHHYRLRHDEIGYSVKGTWDGGFMISGETYHQFGDRDVCVIRTDSMGNELWRQTYGGPLHDYGFSVIQCRDGGYAVAGWYGFDYISITGDFYLIRLEGDVVPLNVILTPLTSPILIPSGGGSFDYTAVIENRTIRAARCDVWTEVVLPGGSVYGPLLSRMGVSIPPGGTLTRQVRQNVPGYAPAGRYCYLGKAGLFPDSVAACDTIGFAKLHGQIQANGNFGWEVFDADEISESVSIKTLTGLVILSIQPNPFNQRTAVGFQLSVSGEVNLAVYDITGREVAVLAEGWYPAGSHQVVWDAEGMSSGIYFVR